MKIKAILDSIVDEEGSAVAVTYTLNLPYGSGVTVPGAGFLLNDEMDDFAAKPSAPNAFHLVQDERNAIAPGKRPLSSMTPTIILTRTASCSWCWVPPADRLLSRQCCGDSQSD